MIRMEVEGLAELEQKLLGLGEHLAMKVLRDAGKEAMEVVREDMQEGAGFNPRNEGEHMRDNIALRSVNRMKDGRWITMLTIRVGPSKAHTMKALAQEFGTSKQVARPFMRPALDFNRAKILRILAVRIREGIEHYR